MKLEQVERDGRVAVRLPKAYAHCPSCGLGGSTLKLDIETLTEESLLAMAEQPLRCADCGWEGTAFDVYYSALQGKKASSPVSVEFTPKDLKVLKEAIARVRLEYQSQMMAEEIGEGGTPEREEAWRQKLVDLERVARKLP